MPFDIPDTFEQLANQVCALRDQLIDAAAFVGGSSGARRAATAIDAFMTRGPYSRLAQYKLRSLLGLLLLEEPADPEAEIATVAPWDPRAEEVMLLADHLAGLLDALARHGARSAA